MTLVLHRLVLTFLKAFLFTFSATAFIQCRVKFFDVQEYFLWFAHFRVIFSDYLRTCDLALLGFSRFEKYLGDFSPNSYQFDLERIIMPAVI